MSFYTFYTKNEALDKLDLLTSEYKLFSYDSEKADGSKIFFLCTYNLLYNDIITNNNSIHYYENYNDNQNIKLFFDIDCKIDQLDKNILENKDDFLDNVIVVIKKLLDKININYDTQKILILDASTNQKYSFHIIFPNIIMNNVIQIKLLLNDIDDYNNTKKYIDNAVYRNTCFRTLYSSKINKNNTLKIYKKINYDNSESNKQLFMDSLLLNFNESITPIVYNNNAQKQIHLTKQVKNISPIQITKINDNSNITEKKEQQINNIDLDLLEKIIDIIGIKYFKNYNDWIMIACSLKNSNCNSFPIWNKYSALCDNYCGEKQCLDKWNSLNNNNKKQFTINTLKWIAKNENQTEYYKLFPHFDKKEHSINEPIQQLDIKQEYLLINQNVNLNSDNNDNVANFIKNYFNSDCKNLIIKSPYGTGKTKLLQKIINDFNVKKVLFISYRKTLSNDLHGNFKDLNFQIYTDNKFKADKLICQVDSIHKISDWDVPTYDLVILDEIESVLNHFSATTLDQKEFKFDLLKAIIHNSKKCIMLDGDIGKRTLLYASNISDNYCYIKNEFPKSVKHFIFQSSKIKFDDDIQNKLTNNKKIIIVSMSSEIAHQYYYKYYKNYKVALHTSKTDDDLFNQLKDVNTYWSNFDIVIYSPSIESGVDFNLKYFDNMYCILAPASTSQRGFMQMANRIRILNDNNIQVFLNGMTHNDKVFEYTYSEVKNYFNTISNKYANKKIVYDKDNKAIIETTDNLYNNILIFNLLESFGSDLIIMASQSFNFLYR